MKKEINLKEIFINKEKLYSSKELFSILGYEYSKSKCSRDSIFKKIESKIKLEKIGRKYKIIEIYEQSKEIRDNRGKSNNYKGIYKTIASHLILEFIRKENKNDLLYISANTIATNIKAVNINYRTANKYRNNFTCYTYKKLNLKNEQAKKDLWFDVCTLIKNKVVESSLKKLEKDKYIKVDYGYIIIDKIIKQENKFEYIYNLADTKDRNVIEDIENKVAEKMEFKNKNEVDPNKKVKFYNYCNAEMKNYFNKLYEERYNSNTIEFHGYYMGYRIKVLKDIQELKEDTRIELENKLNNIIIDSLYKKFVKKHNKQIEENNNKAISDISTLEEWEIEMYQESLKSIQEYELKQWEKDRVKENYLTDAKKLIDIIINKNYKDIVYQISCIKLKNNNKNDIKGLIKKENLPF